MLSLYTRVKSLWLTRDRGASAVEYGLMVAAIAAVIVALVFVLGNEVKTAFQDTCNEIAEHSSAAGTTCAP